MARLRTPIVVAMYGKRSLAAAGSLAAATHKLDSTDLVFTEMSDVVQNEKRSA